MAYDTLNIFAQFDFFKTYVNLQNNNDILHIFQKNERHMKNKMMTYKIYLNMIDVESS